MTYYKLIEMRQLFITLITIPLLAFVDDKDCKQKIRTDGYYLYTTNLNDTFKIVPNSQEDWLSMVKLVKKEVGLEASPDKSTNCLPDSVIFTGGPFLNYIAFFNDSIGTSIVTQCTDINVHRLIMTQIHNRRNNLDTTILKDVAKIHDIKCIDENVIVFYVSTHEFFKTRLSGTVLTDSLILRELDENNPLGMYDEIKPRVYHFHEFN